MSALPLVCIECGFTTRDVAIGGGLADSTDSDVGGATWTCRSCSTVSGTVVGTVCNGESS